MYGGHVGIALAGKGYRETVPLWLLLIATQLPDWADAAVCVAGIESPPSGMLSHSLPAVAVLSAALSLLYFAVARDLAAAGLVAAIVVSHAVADYATGIKPTWPGGPQIGLQLYKQPALDFILEASVIVIGWMIYRRSLPEERRNSNPVNLLLFCLLLLQLAASVSFLLFPGVKKC
jgi:LexA-binding, inner membrane-associated putative hydrolase